MVPMMMQHVTQTDMEVTKTEAKRTKNEAQHASLGLGHKVRNQHEARHLFQLA